MEEESVYKRMRHHVTALEAVGKMFADEGVVLTIDAPAATFDVRVTDHPTAQAVQLAVAKTPGMASLGLLFTPGSTYTLESLTGNYEGPRGKVIVTAKWPKVDAS